MNDLKYLLKPFWEIIKTWEWGNNFILPLLVIILTAIGWEPLKKILPRIKTAIRISRREASYNIFRQCIISSDFKSPCALNKIKMLKRLREKKNKAVRNDWPGHYKDYFEKLIKLTYSKFTNTKLRRKIYKKWLKEYQKVQEENSNFIKFCTGNLSYDENIEYQKKHGIIR